MNRWIRADERLSRGSPGAFAPARDRGLIVEVHLGGEIHIFTVEERRYHDARFGVVAEAGGIRHADEFVEHRVTAVRLQWLRQCLADRRRVRLVCDGEIFAIDEPVWPAWIRGRGHRHRRQIHDIGGSHGELSTAGELPAARLRSVSAESWVT